mgnify:CR=1 FL=1
MDKILYRNPSKLEVIGHCGGDEKNKWPRRTDKKSNAKKIKILQDSLVLMSSVYTCNTYFVIHLSMYLNNTVSSIFPWYTWSENRVSNLLHYCLFSFEN